MQTRSVIPASSPSLNPRNCHSNHRSLKTALTDTCKKHRKLNKELQLKNKQPVLSLIFVQHKPAKPRKQIICLEKTENSATNSKEDLILLKRNLCLSILLKQSILKQFQATLEYVSWSGLYLGVQHILSQFIDSSCFICQILD